MTDRTSPRILITRLSAIGDCIHTVPLLCALRENFPKARICWLVQNASAPLLCNHPCLDELIVVQKGYLKSFRAVSRLRRRLRAEQFDVVLDPQSLTKSSLAGWLSGAPRRIGFGGTHGREISRMLNNELVIPQRSHVIDRYLELLRPLDVRASEVRFQISLQDAPRNTAKHIIQELQLQNGFVVINPGAGWHSKLWPPERYGELARYLGEVHRLQSLVVWGNEPERSWAEQIIERAEGFALLAPDTNLVELAAVSEHARLFVGSDTGPLHLAVAMGTPCVSLHGPTRAEVVGAYGPRSIAVQVECQDGTSRERRNASNEAMRAISVEHVCQACDNILNREGRPIAA